MENILLQPKDLIKQRRETLGLTQKEFACLLNLKESGDRTISGWERGEHAPTEAKLKIIENLSTFIPFKKSSAKRTKLSGLKRNIDQVNKAKK